MVLAPLLMAALASSLDLTETQHAARARQFFENGLALRDNPVEARKRFADAATEFQALQSLGIRNAALYASEGNSWLLAGDVPRAILAYQRGLRHSPADRTCQNGLVAAREVVARKAAGGLGRPPADNRPPWLPGVGFGPWSLGLVVCLYAAGWLCLARGLMLRRRQLLVAGTVGLLLALGTAALLGLATLYEQKEHARPLVVITGEDVPLRRGNGESYSSRYPEKLPRGAEARLLFRRGDWLQIELPEGALGWVPLSAALVDE